VNGATMSDFALVNVAYAQYRATAEGPPTIKPLAFGLEGR